MDIYIFVYLGFYSPAIKLRFISGVNKIDEQTLEALQKETTSVGKWRIARIKEIKAFEGEEIPAGMETAEKMINSLQTEIDEIKTNQSDVTKLSSVQNLLTTYDQQIGNIQTDLNVSDLTVLFENKLAG